MSEKPQCSKRVYTGERCDFSGHLCGRPGKVMLKGRWLCAIHTPEAEAKRKQRNEAKWAANNKEWDARFARERYDRQAGAVCRAAGIVDPAAELPIYLTRGKR